MDIYQGVVRNGRVQLLEDVQLPEGLAVEVRVMPSATPDDLTARERAVLEQMIAGGQILPPPNTPRVPIQPIQPDEMTGTPLSEIIIAERR